MPELPKKSKQVTKGNLNARIDQDVIDLLNGYVKYLNRPASDRPEVVEQLLIFALQSDKDFQRETQANRTLTGIDTRDTGQSKSKKTAAA